MIGAYIVVSLAFGAILMFQGARGIRRHFQED
jgi:hypothetical protein